MKGILTQKEVEALKAKKPVESIPIKKPEGRESISSPAPVVSKEDHYLFSPDNSKNASGYINRSIIIEVGLEQVDVKIRDGVAITDNIEVKDKLIKQGYIYMYSRSKI